MRSARSKTISLLSLGVAAGLLAWSTERGPRAVPAPGSRIVVLPARGSARAYGVDQTVTLVRTSCATVTWGGGKASTVTTPCTPTAGRVEVRKLP